MLFNIKPYFFILFFSLNLLAIDIISKPIIFNEKRIELSKEYIYKHYDLRVNNISIIPRIIVVHWTAVANLEDSFNRFVFPMLPSDRPDIQKASLLNVSAHYMIDRDGSIYQLMPENIMARHVIGLNFSAIGIENVGGWGNKTDLTPAQLQANKDLISYLIKKHTTINYLIGHSEYKQCEDTPLWLEKDKNYRTFKYDPGEDFMKSLRKTFTSLKKCHD